MHNSDWNSLISFLINNRNRIKFLDCAINEIEKQIYFTGGHKAYIKKQAWLELSKLKIEKRKTLTHLSEIIWKKLECQINSRSENNSESRINGIEYIDKVTEAFYFEKQAIEYVKGISTILPDILWCKNHSQETGCFYKSSTSDSFFIQNTDLKNEKPGPDRKIKRFLKKPLRIASFAIALTLATLSGYSQKAELTVNVSHPKEVIASGTVEVNGNDSTYTETLENGSAYFILKDVTSVAEVDVNSSIKAWPVPVENGFLNIEILNNKGGVLNIYEVNGKKLSSVILPDQNEFSFYSQTNIFFVQFISNDGNQETVKVVGQRGRVNTVVQWNNTQNHSHKSFLLAADDYSISYNDTEEDIEADDVEKNIPPGIHEIIDMLTQYTLKGTGANVNTNTNTRIVVTGEGELADVNSADGTEIINLNERFSKYEGLPVSIALTGEYTDPATMSKTLQKDILAVIDTLRNGQFYLSVTGNGSDYLVKNKAVVVGSGAVGTESFFKLQGDIVPLELIVNGTGLVSDTSYFNMNKGERTEDVQLNPASYTKKINFAINSSEASKTIKSFRGYVLINGDTLAVKNFNGRTGTLEYNTNDASEEGEVGATRIPAHQNVKSNMTITGEHNFSKTATITYETSNLPVLIKGERGLAISGVNITGFGNAKITGSNGKATLEMLLDKDKTDANGLPFSNYATTLALASNDIVNKNESVNHTAGNNNEKEITAKRNAYPYVVNQSVSSSNATKTPLGFRGYILLSGDTLAVKNITGTNGQITFSHTSPNINAKTGAKNVPYHSDATEKNVILDGNDNENFVVEADVSYYDVTGTVKEEGTNNPIDANVETEGKNDDTNNNGEYEINNIKRKRDNNNKPLTYTISVVATGDFNTQNKNTTANGENLTVNFVTPQTTHEYWLESNNSSPNGASIKGWKDGSDILSGTVAGSSYESNHIERTATTLTLDSLVTNAEGHIKEITTNYVMLPEGTTHNFKLEEETQENNYNINGRGHLIGAIVAGLPNEAIDYMDDGDIRFTTKKDMTTHDIAINGNGYFDGDIVGNYQPNDTIFIDFVNNPLVTTNTFSVLDGDYVASVGKIQNDDGSYVASANEPRFTQYDAWTTLEKLTNKNLVLVAFSDQAYNLPDDLMNIRGPPNHGVGSYVHDNVTFVNDTIVPATGVPITETQKQEQQDAIDFLANQLITRTGLTLVNHNKIYSDNSIWTNVRGKCIIYKSNLQAGNGKTGDTPNTFYSSDAHTRPSEGYNLISSEGQEGQQGGYDLIMGGNGNLFTHDGNFTVNGLSWEGNVSKDVSYTFPPAFFKQE